MMKALTLPPELKEKLLREQQEQIWKADKENSLSLLLKMKQQLPIQVEKTKIVTREIKI